MNPSSRMYFETVKLSAHKLTVASSMKSAAERRTRAQPKWGRYPSFE